MRAQPTLPFITMQTTRAAWRSLSVDDARKGAHSRYRTPGCAHIFIGQVFDFYPIGGMHAKDMESTSWAKPTWMDPTIGIILGPG